MLSTFILYAIVNLNFKKQFIYKLSSRVRSYLNGFAQQPPLDFLKIVFKALENYGGIQSIEPWSKMLI